MSPPPPSPSVERAYGPALLLTYSARDAMHPSDVTEEPTPERGGVAQLADPDSGRSTLDTLPSADIEPPAVLDSPDAQLRKRSIKAALLGTEKPQRIGRYVVERKLGHGGMGVVFAARDETLDRTVALKVLRGRAGGDGSIERDRLVREAQALAKLRHPAVAVVHEVEAHEGQTYLAMEHVDGKTLDRWLAERQRSWREIVATFVKAGEGLAAAHAADIVHRDFKPANVMVEASGRVVVLDFGLAHSFGQERTASDGAAAAELFAQETDPSADPTMTGTLVGTPAYMSPEQFLAVPTTAASDQFSFCVALYEALWGNRPFAGGTITEQAQRVTLGERPRPKPSGVPGVARRAVLRGLSVRPEERWPSMEALLEQLRRALAPRGLRRAGFAAIGSTMVAAAYLVAMREPIPVEVAPPPVESSQAPASAPASARDRDMRRMQAALSREASDPTTAAALLREVEDPRQTPGFADAGLRVLQRPLCRTVVRDHAGDEPQWAINGPGFGVSVSTSPDGQWVLSSGPTNDIRAWRVDGRTPARPLSDADAKWAKLSPQGAFMATVDTQVQTWTFDGGAEPSPLATYPMPAQVSDPPLGIAFDPSGRRLASGSATGAVYLWDVPVPGSSPAAPHVLQGPADAVRVLGFDHEGRRLLTDSAEGAKIWSLAGLDEGHGPRVEATLPHDESISLASFDPTGTHVVTATHHDRSVRLWSVEGGALRGTWLHGTRYTSAAFVAAGQRVATGDDDGIVRLWSVAAPEQAPLELRGHTQLVSHVASNADATRLVSTSFDGTARVWTLPEAGTEPMAEPLVLELGEPLAHASLTPDGRHVIVAAASGVLRACEAEPRTAMRAYVAPGDVLRTAASRDGATMLVATESDLTQVSGSGAPAVVTASPRSWKAVTLTPDGRWAAASDTDGHVRLWQTDGSQVHAADGELHKVMLGIALSPTADQLAVGGAEAVQVWSVTPAGLSPRARLSAGPALALVFGPDGALWLGDGEGRLTRWTDLDDSPTVVDGGHAGIFEIAFDPQGSRVATLHGSGVTLWTQGDDGIPVPAAFAEYPEGGPSEPAKQGVAMPDNLLTATFVERGRALMAITRNGHVMRWDGTQSGGWTRVSSLPVDHPLGRVVIADDGRTVLTSMFRDRRFHRWDLQTLDTDPEHLQARLWDATTDCPLPALRMELLGDDETTARAAHDHCRERVTK
jgi:WD40 repeat protein/predicted Ser/Thr protein kinase